MTKFTGDAPAARGIAVGAPKLEPELDISTETVLADWFTTAISRKASLLSNPSFTATGPFPAG
ncbi:hypothetical protein D3C86_1058760 [compost metagenome]